MKIKALFDTNSKILNIANDHYSSQSMFKLSNAWLIHIDFNKSYLCLLKYKGLPRLLIILKYLISCFKENNIFNFYFKFMSSSPCSSKYKVDQIAH